MGRLLGISTEKVQATRWESAVTCARQLDATVVLKGAGTVIAESCGKVFVNLTGTPGMARGGMGDALTGLIGGLLAQGLKLTDASQAGVFVHGLAGEIAAQKMGTSAMLVTDLIHSLGETFMRIEAAR
jgi:NAD(P)H-hydrate epimerase